MLSKIGKRIMASVAFGKTIAPEHAYKTEFQESWQRLEETKALEPLEALVVYFDVVSKLEDRGLDDIIKTNKKDAKAVANIQVLQKMIKGTRQPYGWNRTKPGESVTLDNLYLGNIYGLFTKTARFWLDTKNDAKGGWGFTETYDWPTMNSYDLVVVAQVEPMLKNRERTQSVIAEICGI